LAGQYQEAEQYFQRLAQWQPRSVVPIIGQAQVARYMRDPSRARALLSIAQSRGATWEETQLELKLLQIQGGGSVDMLDQLPSMLIESPEFGAEILEAFAIGFETLGTPERAVPYVDKWVEGAPRDMRALQHKAELLATLGQKKEAELIFMTVMRQDPKSIRACRGLSRLKLESGKSEEALAFFDVLIKADPNDIDSRLLRCGTLLGLRRDDEAITELREILLTDRFNFSARHALASKLAERGQHQDVIALIEPLMTDFPDDVSLNYLLASSYTEQGQTETADVHLQRHLEGRKQLDELERLERELKPDAADGEAYLRIANGYLNYKWDEAESWLVKSIIKMPDSPVPFLAMASFQRKKGDVERADEFIKAATAKSG